MTPVLASPRRSPAPISDELRRTAQIARDAAEALADEAYEVREGSRYLLAANRLTAVIDSPSIGRQRLLMASPAVTEMSGRSRTLIEMIENEPDDDSARLQLAKLLLRALIWRPETFPIPAG